MSCLLSGSMVRVLPFLQFRGLGLTIFYDAIGRSLFSVPMKKMSSVEEKPERLKEFRGGLKVHHDRHLTV